MSTKALYYLAVTLLVSTFGIYMPLKKRRAGVGELASLYALQECGF